MKTKPDQGQFSLYNDLPSHVWVTDERGHLIFVNTAWIEYSGSLRESIIQHGLASVIHPEDLESAARTWRASLHDGLPFTMQVRLRSNSNKYHWFSVNAKPLEGGEQGRSGFIGINTRIYEDDAAERPELPLSPDLLTGVLDSIHQCLIIFDPTRRKVIYHVRTQNDPFGFSLPTEFGNPVELYFFIHPQDQEKIEEAIQRNIRGEATKTRFRIQHSQISVKFLEEVATPIFNPKGEISAIIVRIYDVTRESELSSENDMLFSIYQHIITNVKDGIWIADQFTGENIITSASYRELCGYSPNTKVTYQMWLDHIHPDDFEKVQSMLEIQKKGEQFEVEYRMLHPDGKTIWIRDRALPVREFSGRKLVGGVMTDITTVNTERTRYLSENESLIDQVQQALNDFQNLFDGTPIGHYSLDGQGKVIRVNQTLLNWLGYTREELIGSNFGDILGPGQEEIFQREFADFKKRGTVRDLEFNFLRKDGSLLPVLINANARYDADGNYLYSYSSSFDNTELSKARALLQEKEERYHSIFNFNPDLIYLRDFNTLRVVEANQTTLDTLEYSLEELTQLDMAELIDVFTPHDDLIDRLLTEGSTSPFLKKYKTKSGKLLDLEVVISLLRDRDGKPSQFQFVCRDLTARLDAEKRLGEHQIFVRQLLDTLNVGVLVTDKDHKFEYENKYFTDFWGQKPVERLEQVLPYGMVEEAGIFEHTPEMAAGKNIEVTLKRHDGMARQFLIITTERRDRSGLILTFVDVTEEKELEANLIISRDALQRANIELEKAMKLKEEFLSNMSHELRTPLTGIIGLSEILLTEQFGTLSAQQKNLMRHIDESGRHLKELINNILDLSRIEAGKFELQMRYFMVGDVCIQAIRDIEDLARDKEIEISRDFGEEGLMVFGDQRRLKQVLVNLLANAIKFTPKQGRVGVRVQPEPGKETLRLSVWDTGIGILPDEFDQIFQPFVQVDSKLSRQFSGTGLGLSLSRQIINMHNGDLQVESEHGKGSVFHIDLPYDPEPVAHKSGMTQTEREALLSSDQLRSAAIPICVNFDPSEVVRKLKTIGIRVHQPVTLKELEKLRARKANLIILLPPQAVSPLGDIWIKSIRASSMLNKSLVIKIGKADDPLFVGAPDLSVESSIEEIRVNIDEYFRKSWQAVEDIFFGKRSHHIMVAEDNPIVRKMIREYLIGRGFRVTEAVNGEEAIQKVTQLAPDLILMDIQMPILNGLETTRVIRQLKMGKIDKLPIIAVTVNNHTHDPSVIYEAGCDAILEKPIDLEKLDHLINKFLSKTQ